MTLEERVQKLEEGISRLTKAVIVIADKCFSESHISDCDDAIHEMASKFVDEFRKNLGLE